MYVFLICTSEKYSTKVVMQITSMNHSFVDMVKTMIACLCTILGADQTGIIVHNANLERN